MYKLCILLSVFAFRLIYPDSYSDFRAQYPKVSWSIGKAGIDLITNQKLDLQIILDRMELNDFKIHIICSTKGCLLITKYPIGGMKNGAWRIFYEYSIDWTTKEKIIESVKDWAKTILSNTGTLADDISNISMSRDGDWVSIRADSKSQGEVNLSNAYYTYYGKASSPSIIIVTKPKSNPNPNPSVALVKNGVLSFVKPISFYEKKSPTKLDYVFDEQRFMLKIGDYSVMFYYTQYAKLLEENCSIESEVFKKGQKCADKTAVFAKGTYTSYGPYLTVEIKQG